MFKFTSFTILAFVLLTSCAHKSKKESSSYETLKKQCEVEKNWESCYLFAGYIRHLEPEKYEGLLIKSCNHGYKEACPSKSLHLSEVQGINRTPIRLKRSPSSTTEGVFEIIDLANKVTGFPLERAAHKNSPRFLGIQEPFIWPFIPGK